MISLRILPLDPVEFSAGEPVPGDPRACRVPGIFNRTRASSSTGYQSTALRPGDPQPSQRFRRIPPRPLIIVGELFDHDFKSIRRNLSPSAGG